MMGPARLARECHLPPRGRRLRTLTTGWRAIHTNQNHAMKRSFFSPGNLRFALAGGAALLLALPATIHAQSQADKRGGAILRQMTAPSVQPAAKPATVVPPCGDCRDVWVSRPVRGTRGLGARTLRAQGQPTELVARHSCGACHTHTEIRGHGKGKEWVTTKVCPHAEQG
jgi:hypothetical protein